MEVVKELFYQMNQYASALGSVLKNYRDNKEFKKYDFNYWTQFLDFIGMSYAESSKYISLFENLETIGKIPSISPNRLKKIVKYWKMSNIDLDGWLALGELAPQKDFQDEINKLKGTKGYMECNHGETEVLVHCKKCGKWISKEEFKDHQETTEDQETEPEIIEEET